LKQFWNLLAFNNITFFREKQAVFWTFLFPLFMIIFFGLIFGGDSGYENYSVSVGLVNNDKTADSSGIVSVMKAVPVFKMKTGDEKSLQDSLKKGKLNYILIIPKDFKNADGTHKPFELLYNPEQVNVNQIGIPIFEQMILKMNEMTTHAKPVFSLARTEVANVKRNIRYIDWLVPGILSMSLLSSALFGIGVVTVSQREKGQLRRFAVTPLPKSTFIAAQTVQRFILVILQALIIIIVSMLIFHVQMRGSWLVLMFILTIGLLSFSAFGYALAARAKKPETTAAIANVFFFPMMFLSGVYFPVEHMPSYLKVIAAAMPLKYLSDAVRITFFGNETFAELWLPLTVLTAWFVVFFIVAVKTFIWD
jgi:ABC-2 type transport system permease protein